VKTYIREDLTLLAYFLSQFIGDIAQDAGDVSDQAVSTRQWLHDHNAGVLPDVPEEDLNPILYPRSDLSDIDEATREFYEAVFSLREFRDPKVERLADVLNRYDDEKVLVFTQYRATADYVHRTLLNDLTRLLQRRIVLSSKAVTTTSKTSFSGSHRKPQGTSKHWLNLANRNYNML